MPKICLVGAGSTVFAQNILGDVLSSPRGGDYVISLFDIDPGAVEDVGDRRTTDLRDAEAFKVHRGHA
jgi:alpha-galactosidase